MKLSHARDNSLSGLSVRMHAERRVFLHELLERETKPFLVRLGLGLNGYMDHRFGENHGFQDNGFVFITEGMPRERALEAHRRADIAGIDLLDLFALVRVHLEQRS